MTDLSTAAQTVLEAIKAVSPAPAGEIAAVALRAAADYVGEWESAEELRAIADELKGTDG